MCEDVSEIPVAPGFSSDLPRHREYRGGGEGDENERGDTPNRDYRKQPLFIEVEPINPLNSELNPICYLLALLAHHFLHVSRIRVKLLTFRLLMSYIYIYIYIYMEHPFLMFLDHTQRFSTVGRTPLDE